MADTEKADAKKPHRKAHSGRKADKKEAKKKQLLGDQHRNPKAFAINNVTKAERRFRRTMDIKSKGYHVPAVDKTPAKPPPAVVAIVGPPKVGKTTLLKCLVKNFTRQKLTSINGPVTLISGKKKRITFIECNNDINNMIDIAKIADLVLLLIDAKSGFEMETFEFLNICQIHGMPRLMGVLTHLDLFKQKKTLQRTKTMLKKRYRTEIPRGEKMFYLSGQMYGEYLKNEVHNLGRFISVMKFEPSTWKKTHPYVFVDRMEDITNPENLAKDPNCNRAVCLYGYARGGALKPNSNYHIPGCGDYLIRNIHFLPDPCPLPEKNKKRSLNEKERLIYAPMSGVGGIVYDKDAVYIELRDNQQQKKQEEEKPADKLVNTMVAVQHPIDEKMKAAQFQLFAGAKPLGDKDMSSEDDDQEDSSASQSKNKSQFQLFSGGKSLNDDDLSSSDDDEDEQPTGLGFETDSDDEDNEDDSDGESDNCSDDEGIDVTLKKKKKKVRFADDNDEESAESSDSDEGDSGEENDNKRLKKRRKLDLNDKDENEDELGQAKWKENLLKKAADDFYQRQKETVSLQKLVYGHNFIRNQDSESESDGEIGNLFFIAKHEKDKKNVLSDNDVDCSRFVSNVPRDWSDQEILETIKDCFVTGKWEDKDDAEKLLEEDDDLFGDFEDFETGTVHKGKSKPEGDTEKDESSENEEQDDKDETEEVKAEKEKTAQEKRMEKKKKLKEMFNKQFDDSEGRSYHDDLKLEADTQGELNKTEFEGLDDELRVQYEGFRPGLYLRLEVEEMPCEFIRNFDPSYPIILGSLLKNEEKMGYLQARIKKHRWYPKILKTRDPLIVSLGWRRFQTVPLYYIVDHNKRNRHLKYTPKHLHCMAAFWGPITQQKSGILGVQTVHEISFNFRIAAVGSITEVNETTNIVKKLKLLGTPLQVFKKTAFIEGMFHSSLEVGKYEGAALRTVSGIRGQIKKAIRDPPGVFRATFEDKIQKSDIVFLRTWVTVTVPQFCIPVTSLLLPPDAKSKWQGARTLGKLRFDKGLSAPVSEDSKYIPIERQIKQFAPLVVPKNLQKALPFKDKIIHKHKTTKDPETERVAVIKEPHEREVSKVLSMLKTVHQMKLKKQNKAMWLRARAHNKEKKKNEAVHHKKVQAMKKRILRRKPNKAPDM
ncbi:ribosome biogenesis protein BMS1 homolog isoform X3 [Parasteatoda tepidariorum]|uniref:ribosome biogenesis protein BMS1 homolog isoform X3 n=1 Tax=Parasteatoda tepidariorum TaxID=114398 RepID=UPI001C71F3F0|nr:ribosome biogenesis protein BMS1 homolog isoform X3 [Parasteatoda tepidariorum]